MMKMSSLMNAHEFLAQTAAPAAGPGGMGGGLGQMAILYGLLGIGFYFLFIAPQRKKVKETEAMMKALQSGDEVITTAGIYGVITNVKEDRFVIRIAEGTKIEVGKAFIQAVTKKQDAEKK